MSFERGGKRLLLYLLTFLSFLTMWLIKELQIIVSTGTVSSYLMTTNRYAFNYFDNLMLSEMYIPPQYIHENQRNVLESLDDKTLR